MKKLLQAFYSYKEFPVEDAFTHQKETATRHCIFGFCYKLTYRPAETCDHSKYLGII